MSERPSLAALLEILLEQPAQPYQRPALELLLDREVDRVVIAFGNPRPPTFLERLEAAPKWDLACSVSAADSEHSKCPESQAEMVSPTGFEPVGEGRNR